MLSKTSGSNLIPWCAAFHTKSFVAGGVLSISQDVARENVKTLGGAVVVDVACGVGNGSIGSHWSSKWDRCSKWAFMDSTSL